MWVALPNLLRTWTEEKAQWRRILSSCLSSRRDIYFSCLWTLTRMETHTTGSPEFPACQLQPLGLLSLHNHVSQSLVTHLLFGSASLENLDYYTGVCFYWLSFLLVMDQVSLLLCITCNFSLGILYSWLLNFIVFLWMEMNFLLSCIKSLGIFHLQS